MISILAGGEWRQQQVLATEVPSSHVLPAELAPQVEAAWRELGARPGVKLFDGAMVRWEGLEATPERLEMRVSRTSYKWFVGTNMRHPEWADRYGPQAMANPVGLSAALVSSDGFLLLGRRNARVAYYPNRLHPFAGSLEPAETTDPFRGIAREMHEELKLSADELRDIACLGVVEDASLRQGEMVFRIQATLPSDPILARLDQGEHRSAVSVPPERRAVESMLARRDQLTPVAAATLMLWGRAQFGQDWFEQQNRAVVSAPGVGPKA